MYRFLLQTLAKELNMSICYILPETVTKKSTISDKIPANYDLEPLLPKVTVTVHKGEWGIMIHFSGTVAGCYYSELYCETEQGLELEIRISDQLISHAAMYAGSITLNGQGKTMFLQPGLQSLHYFPNNIIYTTQLSADTVFHVINICIEPGLIKELESSFPKLKAVYEHYKSDSKKHLSLPQARLKLNSRQIVKLMKNSRYKGSANNVYMRARISDYLLNYLYQIHRHPETEIEILHSRHQEIAFLIAEIKRTPEISFNLSQKAEEIGISPRLLQKAFKNLTGTTAKDYVMQQRLAKAKFLLKKTMLTAAEISAQVGFVEPAYFNKLFKDRTGFTPLQYRSSSH